MCSRSSLNHVYRTVWNSALGAMVAVAENTNSHGTGGSSVTASAASGHRVATPLAITLAVALAWAGLPDTALANPTGGTAVVGQATMTTNGNQLLVTTQNGAGTNYSAINWQSFSIPAGSSTYFQQPTAASTSINRVVTNTPSLIFGTLGSNGNLVLINQSGITVGAGAVVDTAGFTASALRMSDSDAAAGRMRFGDGTEGGTVSVQGKVLARNGDVTLIGSRVETGAGALIQAPNGSTILAAGRQVEITARGLEGIRMQVQAPQDSALNLGRLEGDAVGIFAGTLRHSGLIQANAVSVEGGKVVLKATDQLEIDGTVQAQALGQRGGSIQASAAHVKLDGTALLDASGDLGGGEVLVGGGYQGHDSRLVNAQTTDVAAGAQLKADAVTEGDGGTVVVWADGTTRYRGSLSARGGAQGGNGGRAEVSGKGYLDFDGLVDLRAARGAKGNLLLDPLNIEVGTCADITGASCGYGADITSGSQLSDSAVYSGATSYITAGAVGTLLNTADVTLAATNNITLQSMVTTTGSSSGATTLTLNAGNDILFGSGGGITSSTYATNIKLNASHGIAFSGYGASVSSYGGSITLTAGSGGVGYAGAVTLDSSGSQNGGINVTSDGSVTLGTVSASPNSIYGSTASGAVSIKSTSGSVTTGAIRTNGGQNGINGGSITISAGSLVNTGALSANGYGGYYVSQGGNGGSIQITAGGTVVTGGISAKGGDGDTTYVPGSVGGNGGSVSVTAAAASTVGTVDVSAGMGYGSTVGSGGSAALKLSSGNLAFGTTATVSGASSLSLTASNGSVSQSADITVSSLTVSAATGITLGSSTNQIANVTAANSSSGNVLIKSTGGTLVQKVTNGGGNVDIYTFSPLTVGTGGISATGGISLFATTVGSNSNITINGPVNSSGGSVTMSAYNSIQQNSYVYGATGVSATASTGSITFGPNGYSGGSPLSYSANGVSVTAPVVPLTALTSTGGTVSDFLDQFIAAVDQQQTFSDDPFDPRNLNKDALVVEGQVCTP